jgi:hypothetical protein
MPQGRISLFEQRRRFGPRCVYRPFINTLLQRGIQRSVDLSTASAVSRRLKTAQAVKKVRLALNTPLKQGVDESRTTPHKK